MRISTAPRFSFDAKTSLLSFLIVSSSQLDLGDQR
jgi:hypothetical protein